MITYTQDLRREESDRIGHIYPHHLHKMSTFAVELMAARNPWVARAADPIEEVFRTQGENFAHELLNVMKSYVPIREEASADLIKQLHVRVSAAGRSDAALDAAKFIPFVIGLPMDAGLGKQQARDRINDYGLRGAIAKVTKPTVVDFSTRKATALEALDESVVQFAAAWFAYNLPNILSQSALWTVNLGISAERPYTGLEADGMRYLRRLEVLQRAYYLIARGIASLQARSLAALLDWPFINAGLATVADPSEVDEVRAALRQFSAFPVPSAMRYSMESVKFSTQATVDGARTQCLFVDERWLENGVLSDLNDPDVSFSRYLDLTEAIWQQCHSTAAWFRMAEQRFQGVDQGADSVLTTALNLTTDLYSANFATIADDLRIIYYDGQSASDAVADPGDIALSLWLSKQRAKAADMPHIGTMRLDADVDLGELVGGERFKRAPLVIREVREGYMAMRRSRIHLSFLRDVNDAALPYMGEEGAVILRNTQDELAALFGILPAGLKDVFNRQLADGAQVTIGKMSKSGTYTPADGVDTIYYAAKTSDAYLRAVFAPPYLGPTEFIPFTGTRWHSRQRLYGALLTNELISPTSRDVLWTRE